MVNVRQLQSSWSTNNRVHPNAQSKPVQKTLLHRLIGVHTLGLAKTDGNHCCLQFAQKRPETRLHRLCLLSPILLSIVGFASLPQNLHWHQIPCFRLHWSTLQAHGFLRRNHSLPALTMGFLTKPAQPPHPTPNQTSATV